MKYNKFLLLVVLPLAVAGCCRPTAWIATKVKLQYSGSCIPDKGKLIHLEIKVESNNNNYKLTVTPPLTPQPNDEYLIQIPNKCDYEISVAVTERQSLCAECPKPGPTCAAAYTGSKKFKQGDQLTLPVSYYSCTCK